MKKAFTVLSLFAITILFISMYYIKINQKNYSAEKTLVKAFNCSGAKVVSSEVYIYGRLGKKYDTLRELESITDQVSNSLGMVKDSTYSENTTKNDETIKVEIRGTNEDRNIIDINAEAGRQSVTSAERFISVCVTVDLSDKGLEAIRGKVAGVLKRFGIEPKVNSCIIGSFNGKLNTNQMNDVCIRMFNEIEAKKVEDMRDNSLISVSAYSPFIGDSISVNGRKVNMNLAVRYNSYEKKTYIWLATPVITTEY
ncbi:MAG TPA: YwmB family TATA-box binding protein [Clostridia bacterium]|nr:YwmB family TATA-box binding protein [Clostridia bacterium]